MNPATIYALVKAGLELIPILQKAGQSIAPAMKALINLMTKAEKGTVTQADLDKVEFLIMTMLDEFNEELE